ncbi:uncharacterized protein G2W53_026856 [Senna tora]|uniref:Uncharacterized protein n=1 Tax=Senna tora TaxID=362788 RepID=A0A834THT8_9FABA|nr:uncharacterized protein G2W53_026856 [Senna tora]
MAQYAIPSPFKKIDLVVGVAVAHLLL